VPGFTEVRLKPSPAKVILAHSADGKSVEAISSHPLPSNPTYTATIIAYDQSGNASTTTRTFNVAPSGIALPKFLPWLPDPNPTPPNSGGTIPGLDPGGILPPGSSNCSLPPALCSTDPTLILPPQLDLVPYACDLPPLLCGDYDPLQTEFPPVRIDFDVQSTTVEQGERVEAILRVRFRETLQLANPTEIDIRSVDGDNFSIERFGFSGGGGLYNVRITAKDNAQIGHHQIKAVALVGGQRVETRLNVLVYSKYYTVICINPGGPYCTGNGEPAPAPGAPPPVVSNPEQLSPINVLFEQEGKIVFNADGTITSTPFQPISQNQISAQAAQVGIPRNICRVNHQVGFINPFTDPYRSSTIVSDVRYYCLFPIQNARVTHGFTQAGLRETQTKRGNNGVLFFPAASFRFTKPVTAGARYDISFYAEAQANAGDVYGFLDSGNRCIYASAQTRLRVCKPRLGQGDPRMMQYINTVASEVQTRTGAEYDYERRVAGGINYTIPIVFPVDRYWSYDIDGYRGSVMIDAKYVKNPNSSPVIPGSSATQFFKDIYYSGLKSEMLRAEQIISEADNPFTDFEIIVSDARAKPFFEQFMVTHAVDAKVVYTP
jgi:hypothetical protein